MQLCDFALAEEVRKVLNNNRDAYFQAVFETDVTGSVNA